MDDWIKWIQGLCPEIADWQAELIAEQAMEDIATEREACAKIAMEFWCDAGAEAIRARGQK